MRLIDEAGLVFLTGNRVGEFFPIPTEGLVIGRARTCDLVFNDEGLSRKHLVITIDDDRHVLKDTSRNGVYVNQDRVEGTRILVDGDRISLAKTAFRYVLGPPMMLINRF